MKSSRNLPKSKAYWLFNQIEGALSNPQSRLGRGGARVLRERGGGGVAHLGFWEDQGDRASMRVGDEKGRSENG